MKPQIFIVLLQQNVGSLLNRFKEILFWKRVSQEKGSVKFSVIGSANKFSCYKLEKLMNSFLNFFN